MTDEIGRDGAGGVVLEEEDDERVVVEGTGGRCCRVIERVVTVLTKRSSV